MAVTLASVDGTWTNSPTYDAAELRRADAAMIATAGIASGLAVSVDGSDVVTVTRGQAVISGDDAVAGTGVYRAGIGSDVSGSLEARDATNARIDLVVFRQYDTDVVGSHGKFKSEIEIVKGTPSATPAVPTKPSMAVELARITVPQAGGGAATVDSTNRTPARAVGADADTGWVPIPAATGWTSAAFCRVIGRQVFLRGSFTRSSGTSVTMGTLPVASRPTLANVSTVTRYESGVILLAINTTGAALVSSTVSTGTVVFVDAVTFLVD